MIYKNCALFKKSLSVIALSLAFQSPYALAMENEQYETVLSNTTLPADCIHNVIVDSDLDTKVKGWSLTCSKLRHFTLGTIAFIPKQFMNNIADIHLSLFCNLVVLDLQNNTSISGEALSKLTKLTRLNLSHNSVITDNVLIQFPELTQLGLAQNNMITSQSLSQLTNLTALDLERNFMISDNSLSNLTNLTVLNLEANKQITDLALTKLTNLMRLNLEYNYTINNGGVSTLTNLQYLGLHGNTKFTDLAIDKLTNLTELDLVDSYFACAHLESLSKLIKLKYLSISSRNFRIFEETRSRLTNLIGLYFSDDVYMFDSDDSSDA